MKTFIKRIFSSLSLAVPFFCFLLFVVNLVLAFFSYRSSRPQFLYRCFVVTNYLSNVVTSFVGGVSSSSSSSPSSVSVPPSFSCDYDYMVISGEPCFRFAGKVYHEGDICSRGLVLRIFPDRVFLMDGSILENSRYVSTRTFQSERIKLNDRKSGL